jgi:hypothetical protein
LTYASRFEDRKLIDSLENFLGSRCLVYEENGEYVRGVLDSEKLTNNHCLILKNNVHFIVSDEENKWEFGTPIVGMSIKAQFVFPAVVAYQDTTGTRFVPARVEGRIGGVASTC